MKESHSQTVERSQSQSQSRLPRLPPAERGGQPEATSHGPWEEKSNDDVLTCRLGCSYKSWSEL